MPKEINLNLKAILKTIEGELQSALYYNSNAIFAKEDTDSLFFTRKVYGILEGIKQKIDELNGSTVNERN